jgi:hypothetical protein
MKFGVAACHGWAHELRLVCLTEKGCSGQVAQLVEHTTENRGVDSSILSLATCWSAAAPPPGVELARNRKRGFTCVAQLVEHRSPKPAVGGSIPSARVRKGARLASDEDARLRRRPRAGHARVAQLVEHFLGKEEVSGSSPDASSVREAVRRLMIRA